MLDTDFIALLLNYAPNEGPGGNANHISEGGTISTILIKDVVTAFVSQV